MNRIFIAIFLILLSNIEVSKANIFNNFAELNSCISGYKSFNNYKSKLKSCYNEKGIAFEERKLNSLSIKKNVIKDSGFNLKKYTNSENISKLKEYTFNNPNKI